MSEYRKGWMTQEETVAAELKAAGASLTGPSLSKVSSTLRSAVPLR